MRVNRKVAEEIIKAGIPAYVPGMSVYNASGDVDATTSGYDYAIRTTTFLAAKTVMQLFYEVDGGLGAFIPIVEGEGAYLEDMRINRQFMLGNSFELARVSTMTGHARIGGVGIANIPITIKYTMFAEGFQYNEMELQKSLRSLNWDLVGGGMTALKKFFDQGVQKVAFLGLADDQTNTPGFLTMPGVTSNTTRITANISGLSATDFQTFVAGVLADYRSNCAETTWPDTFVMPMSDYVGMASAASTTAVLGSKLSYLLQAFKEITMNNSFRILPLAYSNAARNAGYVSANGKNRYVLYKNDVDTLRMEHPVPFTLSPSVRVGALNFETAAVQQISGTVPIKPAEILYYDWS